MTQTPQRRTPKAGRPLPFTGVLAAAWLSATLVMSPRSAEAQVDTPAAREARAMIRQARQTYAMHPEWRKFQQWAHLEDLELELRAGDLAQARVIQSGAKRLLDAKVARVQDQSFQRLAEALKTRADELAPIPAEQWPESCREQSRHPASIDHDAIRKARQDCAARIDELERVLRSLGKTGDTWKEFLLWPDTRALAAGESLDATSLDLLEARWSNAPNVWDTAELIEASLAARTYLRLARAEVERESSEQHAAAWNELADLLAETGGTARPDLSRIAALVASRERIGQASSLTGSIRRALSQPNIILAMNIRWLQSQMISEVDEPYQVNGTFAGSPTTGAGRLRGAMTCRFLPSSSVGRWILRFEGTSTAATTGGSDGVRVQSRATTNFTVEKPFTLSALGILSLPAEATASTTIAYDDVSPSGGRIRRNRAVEETYARRGQAEAESAALARSSLAARLDTEADKLSERLNRPYRENLRDRLAQADGLTTQLRVRAAGKSLTCEAHLEHAGRFATSAPPELDPDASASVCCTARALESLAAATLGGRHMTGEQLGSVLGEILGKSSAVEPADQDFRIAFADEPCEIDFSGGRILVRFHVTSFEAGDVQYPAMTIEAVYQPQRRDGASMLARQGPLSVKPRASASPDEAPVSGRRQALQVAVRRKLNKVLAEEIVWQGGATATAGDAPTALRPKSVQIDGGWLKIELTAEPSVAAAG